MPHSYDISGAKTLTVGEVRDLLATFPQDLPVLFAGEANIFTCDESYFVVNDCTRNTWPLPACNALLLEIC